jgi:tryptophanase
MLPVEVNCFSMENQFLMKITSKSQKKATNMHWRSSHALFSLDIEGMGYSTEHMDYVVETTNNMH